MVINLSNHPLNTWSDNQVDKAKKLYGKIVDLSFPQIPPDADENTVLRLAEDFKDICIDILSDSKDQNNAVHIMGELTFCFALVTELKKNNITCIASTTDRESIETLNGKLSKFNFVNFRKYSSTD